MYIWYDCSNKKDECLFTGTIVLLFCTNVNFTGRMHTDCVEMICAVVEYHEVGVLQFFVVAKSIFPYLIIVDIHHCYLSLPNKGKHMETAGVSIE